MGRITCRELRVKKVSTIIKVRNEEERDSRAATEDRVTNADTVCLQLDSFSVPCTGSSSLYVTNAVKTSRDILWPGFLAQKSIYTASLSKSDTHS
jgi:hypothetical protein